MSKEFSNKVALITGTSSGIGLYTAVMLAQAGYTVVATMRDTAKAGQLQKVAKEKGVEVIVKSLDVQDDTSVTNCLREVINSYGRIDLLVNNAGAGRLGSLEQLSMADLRETMEVNFFGVWRMTQAVFPLMREAGSGRIISVSSVGGVIAQPLNDAYCAAKFAVEGFMESLAPVAKRLGIEISLIEPGPVNTEFVGSVRAKGIEVAPEFKATYGYLYDAYLAATEQVFASFGQTPEQIGSVIVEAATTATPHFRYPTSEVALRTISQKYVDPTGDSVLTLSGSRLPQK